MVVSETTFVARLQALTAETTLDDCEKSDLWEFAKDAGLADKSEWPTITKEELVQRIRHGFPMPPVSDGPLAYVGPLAATRINGVGIVRRGVPIERESVTDRQWDLLNTHPAMGEVGG